MHKHAPSPGFHPQHHIHQVWCCMPWIPVWGAGRLESGESQDEGHPWLFIKLEASLGHKRPSLKTNTQKIFLSGYWTKGHSDKKLAKSRVRPQESMDLVKTFQPRVHICMHFCVLMCPTVLCFCTFWPAVHGCWVPLPVLNMVTTENGG